MPLPAPLVEDLAALLALNCRDFLHYLLESHPRPGSIPPDRLQRLVATLGELAREEDRLTEEILTFAQRHGVLLEPGPFPLEYTAYHYLELQRLLEVLARLGEQEVAQLGQLKQTHRTHPHLGPLTARVLSARRSILRRVQRLARTT